jgi:hypothetical protein
MAGSGLSSAIRDLHGDALAGLTRALGRGTALLVARVGDGERELVEQYDRPFLAIDGTLLPDRTSVRRQLLRSAVTHLLEREPATALIDLGPDGDVARQALAEAYGPSVGQVMTQLQPDPKIALRLSPTDALAGIEAHVPVVVFDAHRLDYEARWDVRELERPVLLVTRPEHLAALTGQDAPFYGHTQTITLRAPQVGEWMRALDRAGYKIQPTDLEWLLDRTRGRVGTTMTALRLKTSQQSHRAAWRRAVQNTVPQAHELLALVRAIHADAPTLLLALAEGRQPYTAIPEAPSQRIARAMTKLRELDVVERPERNVSQIADPLIEHALRSILNSSRMREALESVYADE